MLKQIKSIFGDNVPPLVSTCDPALRWAPTYDYNEKIFMKGHLRGFDPEKSLLSNVGPSSLVIMLIGTAIGVEWEGLLVDLAQNDLHLGSTYETRGDLAIFRDM